MIEAASISEAASLQPDDLQLAMRNFFETIRSSGNACGPSCLLPENLPQEGCTTAEITKWLKDLPNSLLTYIYAAEKNKNFRFGSKTERAVINQRNLTLKEASKNLKKHKDKRILLSEYMEETSSIKRKIETFNQYRMTLAEKTLNQSRRMDLYTKTIQRLEGLLKEYEEMTIIENTEEASAVPDTVETKNPEPASVSKNPDSSDNPDSPDSSDSPDNNTLQEESEKAIPNDTEIDRETNVCRTRKTMKKEVSLEKKSRDADEILANNPVPYILSNDVQLIPIVKGRAINPLNGEIIEVYSLNSRIRTSEILHNAISQLQNVCAQTITVRGKNGEEFEINPATTSELQVVNKDGQVVANLNSKLLLNTDSPECEAAKKELNAHLQYGESLLSILTVEEGRFLLSPTEFLGIPSQILGARPVFVRHGMSEQHAIAVTVDSMILLTSKGRIVAKGELLNNGAYFSKQHVVETSNGLIRALKPLAENIRGILLKNVSVWHNDETTFRCAEMQKNPDDDSHLLRIKNYVWALVTGKHEELQGTVYFASRTRKDEEFLNQLGENITSGEIAINYVISDAYKGYSSGIEKLEGMITRTVRNAGCYFHLRQYFLEAIENMGLSDVFYEISTCAAEEYPQKVTEALKKWGIQSSQMGRALLRVTFLIELLLRLDEDFAVNDCRSLEERRARVSKPLVEHLYESISKLVSSMPGARIITDGNGNQKFESEINLACTDALRYAINHKKELTVFLSNGDVELTNNYAELMLRDVVRTRTSSQHFYSRDGFQAYANLMTIVKTCVMNGINPYQFIQWTFDNAKLRLEEYRLTDTSKETTAQICYMPSAQYVVKNGEKVKISMYDKEYSCVFDRIDWKGIDPWTYKRIMAREISRLKKPPKEE